MERRLAAVLAAEVVGYSRMMEQDEVATHQRLKALNAAAIEPLIDRHGGRIVNRAGDGLLVEFPSVVNAVTCGHEWQPKVAEAEPGEAPILHRIGISVGEIIFDDGDIFGTGVNIAARLEPLADPGGVCVSAEVEAQCVGRVAAGFADMGEAELKNIKGKHRLYRLTSGGAAKAVGEAPAQPKVRRDTPSLAVLPFTDLANSADAALLVEGFTEEITATLSKTRWLFLVAANSTMTYRGRDTDARAAAEELGVRYTLRGAFMARNDRLRINASLIDGETEANLRSFRFDGTMDDPFQLIDDVAMGVVGELLPEISHRERSRARSGQTGPLTAWDTYLRFLDALRANTEESCREAIALFHAATAAKPDFAMAHTRRATCAIHQGYYGWGAGSREAAAAEAMEHASRALAADPDEAHAFDALASAYQLTRNFSEAEHWARRAITANPTCVAAYGTLTTVQAMMGEAAAALETFDALKRVSPRDPDISSALMGACMANFLAGNLEEAVKNAREHIVLRPNWYGSRVFLAASLAHLGEEAAARTAVDDLLRLLPGHTLARHRAGSGLGAADLERLIDGLRTAGLPEG